MTDNVMEGNQLVNPLKVPISRGSLWADVDDFWGATLPRTNMFAPENGPGPKKKVVCQPPIFKGYLSFREGIAFPETDSKSTWKLMVGRQAFPFGARPIFRGELLNFRIVYA